MYLKTKKFSLLSLSIDNTNAKFLTSRKGGKKAPNSSLLTEICDFSSNRLNQGFLVSKFATAIPFLRS